VDRGGPSEAEAVNRYKLTSKILRSLAASENRRKLLLYLSNNPQKLHYLEELVRNINISHSNVLGALFGDSKNYSKSSSLVSLGLVEAIATDGYKYYRLTEVGLAISKSLNGRK